MGGGGRDGRDGRGGRRWEEVGGMGGVGGNGRGWEAWEGVDGRGVEEWEGVDGWGVGGVGGDGKGWEECVVVARVVGRDGRDGRKQKCCDTQMIRWVQHTTLMHHTSCYFHPLPLPPSLPFPPTPSCSTMKAVCLDWRAEYAWTALVLEVLCEVGCNDMETIYLVEEVDLGDGVGDISRVPHQNNYQLHKRIHRVIALCTRHC